MSLKLEVMNVSSELLEKAFEFAAHALNDSDVVKNTCKELGIPLAEGYALVQFFAEIGINGTSSMTNLADLEQAITTIKAGMPNLS